MGVLGESDGVLVANLEEGDSISLERSLSICDALGGRSMHKMVYGYCHLQAVLRIVPLCSFREQV